MIWCRRNDFIFNRGITSPAQIMVAVKSSLEGFSQATSSGAVPPIVWPLQHLGWIKPPEGSWKINWDAATAKKAMMMGVGVVIRDAAGCVVAAKATTVPYIVEPMAAETMAAWCAVEFGRASGAGQVILEGDIMVVVDALRVTGSCDRDYGQLIADIKEFCSHFSSVEVMHARRESNKAAHVLAKRAISQLLDNIWVGECPSFIRSVVAAECSFAV